MKYLLYERLLAKMEELRPQAPHGYVWGERPFKMYFDGLAFTGPVGGVDCSGSTLSAFYLEWQGLCQANFASTAAADTAKRLPGKFYEFFVPYGDLSATSGFPESCVGALHRYAGITIGDGGAQNVVADLRNLRRGDIAQIWWKGLPDKSGHSVFIHDVLVDHDGTVWFQVLSSQNPGHQDTDGIGVAGTGVKNYNLTPTLQSTLFAKGTWYRHEAGKPGAGVIPEMYLGRFRRPFPCWPCALPGKSSRTLPLPLAVVDSAEGTLHPEDCETVTATEYVANAESAGDGFYPLGLSRTWHGGIHLAPGAGSAVRAISDGVIVAARCPRADKELAAANEKPAADEAVEKVILPSRSFVLIRHQAKIDGAEKVFFSLYLHLSGALGADALFRARWLWQSRQKPEKLGGYKNKLGQRLDTGDVVLLAYPVAAGDVVGFTAGEHVHLEVFSEGDLTDDDYPDKKLIDDPDKDLFADSKELFAKLDSETNLGDRLKLVFKSPGAAWSGVVLADEIKSFFKDGDEGARKPLRSLVTRHISEWSTLIEWPKIQKTAAWGYYDDAAVEKLKEVASLYAWLSPDIASRCKLPADHLLYHYHPIVFVEWLANKVKAGKAEQLIQDVTPFLADAGEEFSPTEGHKEDEVQWVINPAYKPGGTALRSLVLFEEKDGKPSPQVAHTAEDPPKPLKEPGPWTKLGDVYKDPANKNQYIKVQADPGRWLCVATGSDVYAKESG